MNKFRPRLESLEAIEVPAVLWGDGPAFIDPLGGVTLTNPTQPELTVMPDGAWVLDFSEMTNLAQYVIGNENVPGSGQIHLTLHATVMEIGANGLPTGVVGQIESETMIQSPHWSGPNPPIFGVTIPTTVWLENNGLNVNAPPGFLLWRDMGGQSGSDRPDDGPYWDHYELPNRLHGCYGR